MKICFISLATRRWWGPCVRTCSELSWVVLSRHWQPHRRRRSRPVGSPPSSPATRRSRRWPLVAEPQVVPVSRGMAPHRIHARHLILRFRQCFGGENMLLEPKDGSPGHVLAPRSSISPPPPRRKGGESEETSPNPNTWCLEAALCY